MTKSRRAGFAGLLVATALLGGTIIASVAASTTASSAGSAPLAAAPSTGPGAAGPAAAYCADFRRTFAARLGVDESALAPAAKAAAISTIDAAVAAGSLTAAAGDRLKARVEAADANACALLGGRLGALRAAAGGSGRAGGAARGTIRDGLAAAATVLGMTPAELGGALQSGKTLQDVATSRAVPYATVSAAVTAAVRSDLAAAVAAGTIRQARADRILGRLQAALASGHLRSLVPAAPVGPSGSALPTTGG